MSAVPERPAFPLSAIVGQRELIEALLINAVDPEVGGVLIRGQRGTAKTTAVRALASLLAPAPLVELPLGTTLDRLVGSLDLREALAGDYRFEHGLLSKANGGILYVDEVNLLADHLVDALLDAAATGVARVEREAVSMTHAARFILVGTMNVEEGELRPQLLDRFGLGIEVTTPTDAAQRAEIVRRRLAYEADPVAFLARFQEAEAALGGQIEAARALLAEVVLPERELLRITRACAELAIDGVRGDIVTARTAKALAALAGERVVGEQHVRAAAVLALAHRRRRDPLEQSLASDDEDLRQALTLDDDGPEEPDDPGPNGSDRPDGSGGVDGGGPSGRPDMPGTQLTGPSAGRGARAAGDADAPGSSQQADPGDEHQDARGEARNLPTPPRPRFDPQARARESVAAAQAASLPWEVLSLEGRGRGPAGRDAPSAGASAGSIDSRPAGPQADDIALVATLRSRLFGEDSGTVREHVRVGRESVLLCLVVDASGSMGARQRAARMKGALEQLLREAYARRDQVAVIAFRDNTAQLLVTPGAPLQQAAAALRSLPTGGRTPLAEGLGMARGLLLRERVRAPERRAVAVIITDGRVSDRDGRVVSAAAALGRIAASVVVIDTEEGSTRVGLAAALAAAAGGRRVGLRIGDRRMAA